MNLNLNNTKITSEYYIYDSNTYRFYGMVSPARVFTVGENSGTIVDCGDICIVTTADNKEYITIAGLEYKDDNKFGKELVFIDVPYDIISVKVLRHYYEVNKDTKIGSISYIKL